MQNGFFKLYVKLQDLTRGDQGQDMVEYGLLVSLIALTLIASLTISRQLSLPHSQTSATRSRNRQSRKQRNRDKFARE